MSSNSDKFIEIGKISRANAQTKVIRDGEELELSLGDTLYYNDLVKNNDFDIFMDFTNGKEFFLESNQEVLLDEYFLPVDETIDEDEETEEPHSIQTDAIEQEPHPYYVKSHDEKDIYLERDDNMVDINAKVADATLHNSGFTHHEDENIGRDTYIEQPTADIIDNSDTGSSKFDNITKDDTPTITGHSEPGSKVVITTEHGKVIGTGICNPQGIYTITTQHIDDGAQNLIITATDPAGNSASVKQPISVDTHIDATDDTKNADEDVGSIKGSVLTNDDNTHGEKVTTTGKITGAHGIYHLNEDGTYTYKLDHSQTNHLAAGETLDDTITYKIIDPAGNVTKAQLTTHIIGTNDAPILTVHDISANEDGSSVSGTASFTDVDHTDSHSYSISSMPANEGSVSIDAITGKYTYNPGSDFQSLAAGETKQVSFDITVKDNHGGIDTQKVTVTITGTNDAPDLSVSNISATEDGAAVTGSASFTDVDVGDSHTYSVSTMKAGEGSVSIAQDGTYTYNVGSDFQSLALGKTQDVTFKVTIDDGNGGIVSKDVTVTITGTNDKPVLSVNQINNNSGQLSETDVDTTDTHAFSVVKEVGTFGDLHVDSKTGTYSYTQYQDVTGMAYNNGVYTGKETFEVKVDDGNGGVVSKFITFDPTATLSVTGPGIPPILIPQIQTVPQVTDVAPIIAPIVPPIITNPTIDLTAITDSGILNTDNLTNIDKPTIQGEVGIPFSEVKIYEQGNPTPLLTIIADKTGHYSGQLVNPLPDAVHSLHIDAIPPLVNNPTPVSSTPLAITIDTHIDPSAISMTDGNTTDKDNIINIVESKHSTITGSIDPTAKLTLLEVVDTNGKKVIIDVDPKNVKVDATGHFTVTGVDVSGLTDGDLTVTSNAIDPAGNPATKDGHITLDTAIPLTPIMTIPPLGHDLTPTIGISGTPGSIVIPIINGYTLAPAPIPSGGHADVIVPPGIITPNQPNTITGIATSPTGNVSPQGHSSITVDTIIDAVDDTNTAIEDQKSGVTHGNVLSNDDKDSTNEVTSRDVKGAYGTYHFKADGTYSYDLDNTNPAVQALHVGETIVDPVSYSIKDSAGNTDSATLSTTITGTNDAPVVQAASKNAIEDGSVVTGTMTSSDVDHGSSVTYSTTKLPAGFTLDPNGDYKFNPSDKVYQHLQSGQKETIIIPITATDEHGDADTKNLVIHLTGTNDGAVISEASTGNVTEDVHMSTQGKLDITDVDTNEDNFKINSHIDGKYGYLNLEADGKWTYQLYTRHDNRAKWNEVQHLAEGEHLDETITVESKDGTTYDLNLVVNGHNDNPHIRSIASKTLDEDSLVSGDAHAIDRDTHDTHTFSVKSPVAGFTIDSAGHYTFDSSNVAYQHLQVGQRQVVTVSLAVEDNHGGTGHRDVTFTVIGKNDAPVIDKINLQNTNEDHALHFHNSDLLGHITDAENDKLHILNVHVDPACGRIIDHGMGSYEFRPKHDYNDKDVHITFDVGDGRTTTHGIAHVNVIPVNDKPVVHSVDLGHIDEDTSKTFTEADLLENTTDIDSPLNLLQVENVHVSPSVGVIKGDRIHGFTFTPNLNWNGQNLYINFDVIDDYQAKSSGHAVLDVTPVQDPSIITIDKNTHQDLHVNEDNANDNTASGKLNIQDPDRGDEHFRATSTVTGTYGILKITADGHWTYTLSNTNANVQELNTNEHVTDNIQIHAKDGTAFTISIDVEGTNDNPVIKSVGSVSVKEDGIQVIGQVDATDVDKGDVLTYSLAHPIDGLTINPTTGEYSFDPSQVTHQPLKEGEYKRIMADIVVTDSHGGADTQQLVIDLVGTNDNPVVKDITLTSIDEDTQVKFHTSDLLANTVDVDGDKLIITSVTLQDPTIGTVTEDGKGGYTFKPNNNYNGKDVKFDFVVSDGLVVEKGVAHIDVLPINDAPVVHNVSLGHSMGSVTFTDKQLLANSTDPDRDKLHVDGTPTVDSKYGTIVDNHNGTYTFNPATTTTTHLVNTWAQQHPGTNYHAKNNHPSTSTTVTTQVQLPAHLHIDFVVTDGQIPVHATANISHSSSHGQVQNTVVTNVSVTPAIEDSNPNAHGTLDIQDPDGTQYNHLHPINNQQGTYGVFSVDSNGKWSYHLTDNSNHDIQSLGQGKVIEERFTVTSLDGTTHVVKVPIQGTDDKPVITEVSATTAKEDTNINAQGELHITDIDKGEALFKAANYIGGTHGHLQIDAQGHWIYQLNHHSQSVQQLSEGEPLTDSITIQTVTGVSFIFDVVIHGTNDNPVISMITAQSVNEAGADLNGNIQATDIDTKDNAHLTFSMKAGESAPSGFKINPDGSYTFDPKDPAYSHITNGHTMVIDIPISVNDGHGGIDNQVLKISVLGTNSAPTADATVDLGKTDEDVNKDFTEAGLISLAHGKDLDLDTLHIQYIHVDPSVGTIKDDGNGHYTFVPKANYHHDDVPITYEITDGQKSVVVRAVLDVTSVNDKPVVSHFNLGTTNEDTDKHFTAHDLLRHASDVDGDSLTLVGTPAIDAKYGTITGDITNGFTFTPTPNFHQNSLPIHFIVTDGQAPVQATAQINVRSVADAAVITDKVNDFATEDTKLIATGQVEVKDADGHQDEHMKASSYIKGHFGHLEIDSSGTWVYKLDQNYSVQYLADGEKFIEHFHVQSADGTSHPLDIDILGTNDAGSITGHTTANISEGTGTVGGKLTVHDIDTSEAHAVANPSMPGIYGHLEVKANGQWTYHLNNDAQTESLHEGEIYTEKFTVTSPDGAHKDVVITVTGINDAPIITGQAVLTHSNEDLVVTISEHDLLQNVTDVDNNDVLSIHGISAEHGTIISDCHGGYKYTPNRNFNGQETFHYEVHDNHGGKVSTTMIKEIDAVNDLSVIESSSDLSGTVNENAVVSSILGTLHITDVDSSSHSISIDSSHAAQYGTFALQGDTWSYSLDNANKDVDNLFTGDTLKDKISIIIDDGDGGKTTQEIEIDIQGHSHLAPTLSGGSMQVQDDEPNLDFESDEVTITLDSDESQIMPSLDNVQENLEAKSIAVEIPHEALAIAATLLYDTTVTTDDTNVIKSVENQEKKEPVKNPDAPEPTDSTDADVTAQQEEPAEFIPDVHNQMPQDDENDGTGLTN